MSLCPVILAGGGGTRLWPLSREHYPKQFLKLFGEHSLLQETLLRLDGWNDEINTLGPLVVCNEAHRFLVLEQASQIEKVLDQIILEPEGRNTAPALTVASLLLNQREPDSVIIMMPADHHFTDIKRLHRAINVAYQYAIRDYLVTFGIPPARPETGYGYIKRGDEIERIDDVPVNQLDAFTEKPIQETAAAYLETGAYYWNSGIFMMKASVWLDHIRHFEAEIFEQADTAVSKGVVDHDFFWLDKESFLHSPGNSIDYAVMEPLSREPASKSVVIPADAGWSDVGAWSSVWELESRDDNNNVFSGDTLLTDSSNCLVKSEYRLTTVLGCENLVVVETADAVMVADKDRSQDVKKIVDSLKQSEREERLTHKKVFRPWGSYENLDLGEGFQVKRLTVYPGKKLSLQSHNLRAEHWVVVRGTATVTRGEEVFELKANESTHIPVKTKHRLENAATDLLEIIEVQSGSYLGEDDIVRYEDDFGRVDSTKSTN